MNLRIFSYFTIDHPYKKNEKIIFSNRNNIQKIRNKVYEISKNPNSDRARIVRVHISGEKENRARDTERIKQYEKKQKKRDKLNFNRIKYYEILRFTRSFIIAYLLFLAPESFWSPIISIFNLVAHGLSDYARWCIIFFLPLKAIIRCFGTFIFIKTPGALPNIGVPGQWHKIHENSKTVTLYKRFDESVKNDLQDDISQLISNLRSKDKNTGLNNVEFIDKTEKLLQKIIDIEKTLDSVSIEDFNHQIKEFIITGENTTLWGEMVKLNFLRKELLYFASTSKYQFAPLIQFYPDDPENLNYIFIDSAEKKFKSFTQQSQNLQIFNNLEIRKKIQDNIYCCIDRLRECRGRNERIEVLDEISCSFEKLRDEASRFHMGDNMEIPNEKGDNLALFFHHIYLLFGNTLCDIENRYRRTQLGIFPLISNRAQKKRVKLLFNSLHIYIYGEPKSRIRKKYELIKNSGGKNFGTALITTLAILFLTGSLLSLFTINPGEKVITNNLRIGYLGEFINHETIIYEYGDFLSIPLTNKEIGWHPPPPFGGHRIINEETKELTILMMMGEQKSKNPVKRILSGLSGQLGTKFDVIELKIDYIPYNAENWSKYDKDGKGERRLIRDISELSEEWREQKVTDLSKISSMDFEILFKKLSEEGAIRDFIKRSFSQTSFSTNIYYGSLSERFDAGINAVLKEFEKQITDSEADPFIDIYEKQQIRENLNTASGIVEKLKSSIEEQVTIEYNQLRSNPDELNKLVTKPYENIHRLRDFETLWINISNYTQHVYNQQQMMKILSSGEINMKNQIESVNGTPYHVDFAKFIQDNSLIKDLVKIESIKFNHKTIGLTEFSQYQDKWKDTI